MLKPLQAIDSSTRINHSIYLWHDWKQISYCCMFLQFIDLVQNSSRPMHCTQHCLFLVQKVGCVSVYTLHWWSELSDCSECFLYIHCQSCVCLVSHSAIVWDNNYGWQQILGFIKAVLASLFLMSTYLMCHLNLKPCSKVWNHSVCWKM